jgi:hypothetical protein
VEEYNDEQIPGITAKLAYRIQAEPFNLVATLIFLGAIVHTFLASKFMLIAHRLEHQYHALDEQEKDTSGNSASEFSHLYRLVDVCAVRDVRVSMPAARYVRAFQLHNKVFTFFVTKLGDIFR